MAESNREDSLEQQDVIIFIEPPPDSLQCPLCQSILKQPHLLSCCSSHMCEVN